MEKRKRRRFSAEYKAEAVKRLEESGKPLQAVAEELGVHTNQLRGWRNEQLANGSAEALARQKAETAELARRSLPRLGGHLRKVGATSIGKGRWRSGSGAGSRRSTRARR